MQSIRVLFVEDNEDDAVLLARRLRTYFHFDDCKIVSSAPQLIATLQSGWDVVLIDYNIPGLDVHDALLILSIHDREMPVIVVSGYIHEDQDTAILRLIEFGARDIVFKDNLVRLIPAIARELRDAANRRNLVKAERSLVDAYDRTIEGWSRALDLRDKETEGHTQRVTEMTMRLAPKLGIGADELIHIRRGALLHDIGKMGVPDHILLKPGPLTDEEWVIMKMHPVYAYELLAPIEYLRLALDIPHYHHEKWGGGGYPYGLAGEAIPLSARVFSVVDAFDAMTSDRPYRKGWPVEIVCDNIRNGSGSQFDPQVVTAFLDMLDCEE
jgi:HD-GYP domain-containing protein (c-di-GMP phosphodiesterase class II)